MNGNEKQALYNLKNISVNLDTKNNNTNSGEILLYPNHLIIRIKNKRKQVKIIYKDLSFHAIEKQKRMIVLCDMKEYNIINIFCNSEEDICELFNELCICINNSNINCNDLELEEVIDRENKLE